MASGNPFFFVWKVQKCTSVKTGSLQPDLIFVSLFDTSAFSDSLPQQIKKNLLVWVGWEINLQKPVTVFYMFAVIGIWVYSRACSCVCSASVNPQWLHTLISGLYLKPWVTSTLFTSCAGVPTSASAAEASENVTSLSAIGFLKNLMIPKKCSITTWSVRVRLRLFLWLYISQTFMLKA